MDKANYTENGSSRYPLSTEGLEFIQSQIELIYSYGINSSWELVSSLPDAIGDFECIKLQLPVEFKAVSESVPKILD